ncbi:MAG: KpsF/GutQ family sugar-phosphate isomerase [Candidatus Delongbacteria bacterium]|nr:KpsF/GutQ family sugar-phosphate isomerase [Candidatus Delongbacteria bacterium]MBN2833888.1 KpsF/GutQ family sugar-phosphate isomerase [Candidatus Delongbacteria bacterium]
MIDINKAKILELGKNAINTEVEALMRTSELLDESFSDAVQLILNSKGKVIVSGMGKSGHIATKIAATLSSTGTLSVFLHPAEGLHGDLGIVHEDDIAILIGKSGESDEMTGMLPTLKTIGCKIISITGNKESTLGRNSDVVIDGSIIREACPLNLAPTASTTVALAIGDALATVLAEVKGFKTENFALYHPAGTLGKRLTYKVSNFVHKLEDIAVADSIDHFKKVVISMSDKNYGACLVMKSDSLVGIITDGDIKRVFSKNDDISKILASDVMTKNPKTIPSDMTAYDALQIMKKSGSFSVMPVIENEKVIGIIRLHDLLKSGL